MLGLLKGVELGFLQTVSGVRGKYSWCLIKFYAKTRYFFFSEYGT